MEKELKLQFCQVCKHHTNKPSRCQDLFVGRKNPACADFKMDKAKAARLQN